MRQLRMTICLLIFNVLLSCTNEGTSTGNPLVTFKVNGSSQNAIVAKLEKWRFWLDLIMPTAWAEPSSIVDSSGRTVLLDHFWTTLGEIEFKATETAGGGEVDGEDAKFAGPYTFDILQTAVDPIGIVRLSTQPIRRVKVKLIRTASVPVGAPGGLSGQSIYISGTVNGVAFSVSSRDETVIEVSGPNPVEVPNGAELILQFQVANIFKRMDLGAIAVPTDISETNRVPAVNPCPNIDASAADLYTCFRKGMETEANFGRDNGDDELDSNDDTVR
jgi:hypothetical protein